MTDVQTARLLQQARGFGLAAGYPWIPEAMLVGSREAGAREPQPPIVLAQFASLDEAERWLRYKRRQDDIPSIWRARAVDGSSLEGWDTLVVHVERTTPAWSTERASRIGMRVSGDALVSNLVVSEAPSCSITRDSIFVFSGPELPLGTPMRPEPLRPESSPPLGAPEPDEPSVVLGLSLFSPVRCESGALAWVPVEATRVRAAVYAGPTRPQIRQFVRDGCPNPVIWTWDFGTLVRSLRLEGAPCRPSLR